MAPESFDPELDALGRRVGRYDAGALLACAALVVDAMEPGPAPDRLQRARRIQAQLRVWVEVDDRELKRLVDVARQSLRLSLPADEQT
jgi:hypothetical protein